MKYWFLAVLLIALSAAAYALTSPPVDVPITITPSAVPAPAQAAGFTTHIFHSDFAAQGNTLDCSGTSTPKWFYHGNGNGQPPCAVIVNDSAAGHNVLQMDLRIADYNGNIANKFQTAVPNCSGFCFPITTFYQESVTRNINFTPSVAFMTTPWVAGGSSDCTMEFDTFESFSSLFSDSAMHNCGSGGPSIWGGSAPPNPPAGFALTNYHKYGLRVTTNGTNQIWYCSYIDDLKQGCAEVVVGTAGVTQAMITNPEFVALIMDLEGNGPNPLTQTFTAFFDTSDIWSCANWQSTTAAGGCATSNPNP